MASGAGGLGPEKLCGLGLGCHGRRGLADWVLGGEAATGEVDALSATRPMRAPPRPSAEFYRVGRAATIAVQGMRRRRSGARAEASGAHGDGRRRRAVRVEAAARPALSSRAVCGGPWRCWRCCAVRVVLCGWCCAGGAVRVVLAVLAVLLVVLPRAAMTPYAGGCTLDEGTVDEGTAGASHRPTLPAGVWQGLCRGGLGVAAQTLHAALCAQTAPEQPHARRPAPYARTTACPSPAAWRPRRGLAGGALGRAGGSPAPSRRRRRAAPRRLRSAH
jgi:hypothetical protein